MQQEYLIDKRGDQWVVVVNGAPVLAFNEREMAIKVAQEASAMLGEPFRENALGGFTRNERRITANIATLPGCANSIPVPDRRAADRAARA